MKIYIVFFIIVCCSCNLLAQNIAVKSFKKLDNDLAARAYNPKNDQNGDICAIIKIGTTLSGFTWDSDGLGIVASEYRSGEYWLYIPWGAKRLTIIHPQLGVLRDFQYPLPIEKATVYEMVLTTGKVVTTVEPIVSGQWLLINTEPIGAMVYLNDKFASNGTYQARIKPGSYTYRVEAPLYHSEAGKFDLTDARKELTVKLKPAFGFVTVNSSPEEDARITIDGKPVDKNTPLKSETLASGDHWVQVIKDMYEPVIQKITITDGQTVPVNVVLVPTFGEITITVPENATVYLDNVQKSTGSWKGRLNAGFYSIEVRREKYRPAKQDIEVTAGEKQSIDLQPTPIFGSLDVITTPPGATITLEGKGQVTTPNTINNLLIGEYKVQLSKQGFNTVNKQITIEEGKITMLKETLPLAAGTNIDKDKKVKTERSNVNVPISYSTEYYKYKKRKTFWLVSALVTGAAGTVSYLQAKSVSDNYKTATTDAEDIYKKMDFYNKISPIAFGVAGFCTIEFILTSGKQAKARKLPVSFYPLHLKNGGGLGLSYNF